MGVNPTIPGVYINEEKPGGAPPVPVGTGTVAVVGRFERGPVDKPVRVGSWNQFQEIFGGLAYGSAAYMVYFAFANGAPSIVVVRPSGGSKGELVLKDSNGANKARVKAKVEGEQSSEIKVKVEDGSAPNTYKVTVSVDGLGYSEVYDNLNADPSGNRYFVDVINSKSVLVEVEDLNTAENSFQNGEWSLSEGDEPDYTSPSQGINALELEDDVNIVVTDRGYDSVIRAAVLSHVEKMADRIGIVDVSENNSVSMACDIAKAYDSDRLVITYPWILAYDPALRMTRYFPGSAFYAGRLASIMPYESPTNKDIKLALDTKFKFTKADLEALQNAGISPIAQWDGRGIRIRNGINTSSDPNLQNILRRRMADFIQETAKQNYGWAVGQPLTDELGQAVVASLRTWFGRLQKDGWIKEFELNYELRPPKTLKVNYQVVLWGSAEYVIFDSLIYEATE